MESKADRPPVQENIFSQPVAEASSVQRYCVQQLAKYHDKVRQKHVGCCTRLELSLGGDAILPLNITNTS